MKLRTTHTTTYQYTEPVSICHTEVHLMPRDGRHQRVLEHTLSIVPMPEATFRHKDYFGNDVACFSIHEPHRTLEISAASLIEMEPGDPGTLSDAGMGRGARREMAPRGWPPAPRVPVRVSIAPHRARAGIRGVC